MNKRKLQILFSIFLIALFPLVTALTFQATGSQNEISLPNIASTLGSFDEDFNTDAFKDPGSTAWGWGTGAVSNFRNISLEALDFYDTEYSLTDIEVQGRKAYGVQYNYSVNSYSLNVFDINNPSDIGRTGYRNSMVGLFSLAVDGDVVYGGRYDVASADPLIASYYYTDPFTTGNHLMNTFCDGSVTDIEINGRIVYYTAYNSDSGYSFRIIEAEDPSSHRNITNTWASSKALGLDALGEIVFIAASDEGFYVLNATDKFSPVEVGHVDTPGNATDVIVDGRYAYLADGAEGVSIIDIYDLTNPTIVGSYNTGGNARKLVKQGNTLFVADGANGVVVLDVANPAHPIYVTRINVGPYVWDVDLYGGTLVVASDAGLHTYKICAGYGMTNIGNSFYASLDVGLGVKDVQVQGDIAYVAGGADGIYAVNVRDPTNPILLDQHIQSGSPDYRSIEIRGAVAYVCDFGTGFYTYDIRDPNNIKHMDSLFFSQAIDSSIAGDVAFIADGAFGVYVVNISNPYNIPSSLSFFDIFTNVTSVWVQGQLLYVVDNVASGSSASFFIYDITDILNEIQVSVSTRYNTHHDLKVDGDIVQLSSQVWSSVYNASDPTLPAFTGDLWHDGSAIASYGIWNFGPFILNAGGSHGLFLHNYTDFISHGTNSSNYAEATGAVKVKTHGDFTYVANTTSLVILRHFESAGATFIPGTSTALSTEVDSVIGGVIRKATLDVDDYVPTDTAIEYYLSADGGAHWELVTPGVELEFVDTGEELLWRADIIGPKHRSANIYSLTINYEFNAAPTVPLMNDLGDTKFTGIFKVSWNASSDDGAVANYQLEMSDSSGFGTITKNWTVTGTSQSMFGLGKGTFYFRVRSVDDEGLVSAWSATESVEITMSTLVIGLIAGGVLLLIILIIVIVAVVVRKKKKAG